MLTPITVPRYVMDAHRLPSTQMFVRSAWRMGDRVGLWLRDTNSETGQVWPVFDVRIDDYERWIAAGVKTA
jgi:hypothetical protein